MTTMKNRFDAAFNRLRAQGITPTLVMDERALVRSEYLAAYQLAAKYASTGGRWVGAALAGIGWTADGHLVIGSASGQPTPVTQLFFDFPRHDPSIVDTLREAMSAEGFEVTWTNAPADCCVVRLG